MLSNKSPKAPTRDRLQTCEKTEKFSKLLAGEFDVEWSAQEHETWVMLIKTGLDMKSVSEQLTGKSETDCLDRCVYFHFKPPTSSSSATSAEPSVEHDSDFTKIIASFALQRWLELEQDKKEVERCRREESWTREEHNILVEKLKEGLTTTQVWR